MFTEVKTHQNYNHFVGVFAGITIQGRETPLNFLRASVGFILAKRLERPKTSAAGSGALFSKQLRFDCTREKSTQREL
jgi:hypothetical protein